jgi:autoinducer 2-degrading protein
MYIVTVKFSIHPAHINEFISAIQKQAQDSLELEPACTLFDVSISENDPNLVFLYEIYKAKSDFEYHLKTPHFLSFSEKVAPWVANKQVDTFNMLPE